VGCEERQATFDSSFCVCVAHHDNLVEPRVRGDEDVSVDDTAQSRCRIKKTDHF